VGERGNSNKRVVQKARKKTGLVNWLKHLDEEAPCFSPALTWLQPYDYFLLTRYPRLQPRDDKIGERTYAKLVNRQEQQILAHPQAQQALVELSPERHKEVAALVFDWTVHFQEHAKWSKYPEQFRTRARQSARLARLLQSHRKKVQKSIVKIASAVSGFDPELGGKGIVEALQRNFEQIASAGLNTSPWDDGKLSSRVKESSYNQLFADDLVTLAMVQLFWFFRHGCELSVGESEVRAALIRNELWSDYADPVKRSIQKSESNQKNEESEGCDAVRQAVKRFRLPKGTPR